MVQQLRQRERDTLRVEQPDPHRPCLANELDRENQVNPAERERVIAYRVLEAKWTAAHREQP